VQSRLLVWLGWSGADTIGRLALLTGGTIVFSRLLSPHDFGVTAIVLTVINVASVFVGTPFEEALAQRRALRRGHLRAALAASWGAGLAIALLSVPLGALFAGFYHEPDIALLLPACMASVFFSGHADVITGLARRLRRFSDISIASLFSHLIGVTLSLVLCAMGFGVWALIAQRVLIVVFRAAILQWRIGFWTLPKWSSRHIAELRRYAGLSLVDRLADNVTYLAFTGLIGAVYGVTTLGYVNIAMRLVEPIRGAIGGTSHNLAFSYFASAQNDRVRLAARLRKVIAEAALAIAPVFVGLAAVTPLLLPLAVGPGWEPAINIAVCLSLGSAIALPARLIYSAQASGGRPEFSLIANLAGVVGTLGLLLVAVDLGSLSVGLSRIFGDALQAAMALLMSRRLFFWPRRERLAALAPAWIASGAMGALVALGPHLAPNVSPVIMLVISVLAGVVLYAGFVSLLSKEAFNRILGYLLPARRRGQILDAKDV